MSDHGVRAARGTSLPDALYLRALEVGRRSAGVSGPNPPVGCVIVHDGAVVGEGSTAPVGGPHAEVVALAAAGPLAPGSIAIVTLEPCAHHGRTPPCTDALLAAGVAEVHLLQRDPDRAAAGGSAVLRGGGVVVVDVGATRPDLAALARHDLRGFLARVEHGRPHVTLKLAQTVDGRTVPAPGGYLTGTFARTRVHERRAESDAVLVGGATVRADDPRLDVRLVPAVRQPRPVVLSRSGELPAQARVLREGAVVVHTGHISGPSSTALEAAGVRLLTAPLGVGGGLDLTAAVRALLDARILTVLAEPGVRLAAALLAGGLVDTVELHIAGGADASTVVPALPALAPLLHPSVAIDREVTPDGDLLLRAPSTVLRSDDEVLEGVA